MTKMDLIRNLAEDFNFGELHIAPVEAVKTVPCTLIPMPTQVIFNPPATIVYWEDGDKTVVRCDNDVFSEEFGYAMVPVRTSRRSSRTHSALSRSRRSRRRPRRLISKSLLPLSPPPLTMLLGLTR